MQIPIIMMQSGIKTVTIGLKIKLHGKADIDIEPKKYHIIGSKKKLATDVSTSALAHHERARKEYLTSLFFCFG